MLLNCVQISSERANSATLPTFLTSGVLYSTTAHAKRLLLDMWQSRVENRTLFRCVFRAHKRVRSAVTKKFLRGGAHIRAV